MGSDCVVEMTLLIIVVIMKHIETLSLVQLRGSSLRDVQLFVHVSHAALGLSSRRNTALCASAVIDVLGLCM
jgi:hypothetical protein